MNTARRFSACSVFEGKIVVSGGNFYGRINTVEAYDHVADMWTKMPNLKKRRCNHKSVAVKNKLFVIGGTFRNSCEVFDSTTKKFTLLRQPKFAPYYNLNDYTEVLIIGSKIFLYQNNSKVITYDFENKEWSEKICEATKNIRSFSVLKYH